MGEAKKTSSNSGAAVGIIVGIIVIGHNLINHPLSGRTLFWLVTAVIGYVGILVNDRSPTIKVLSAIGWTVFVYCLI